MTQAKANKILESPLGVQLVSFFCTADDRVFIRYSEAKEHSEIIGNKHIEEWFYDDEI